ncbi:MAG: alpha/beta hydrolase [Candidatus Omnitrophota bacterium]
MAKEKNALDEGLDPQVAGHLKVVRSRHPAHLLSIEELRRDIDRIGVYYPPEPVKDTRDVDIPGPAGKIRVRVYTPEGKGPFPPIIFYHGGGWCIGSLGGYNSICSALANRIPAVVFSVDYRLAPENPFPAAIDDSYAALQYFSRNAANFNADPVRLAVAGDSAGANIAAVISLKAKEERGPRIAFQALIYPAANIAHPVTESYELFGKGYDLDREMIEVFRAHYMPDKKDWVNPYASPALAKDLRGLPPTLLITAEFDPLRDDGIKFAEQLKRAGVPVKHTLYKGVIHGFLSFTTFPAAQRAFDEIAAAFRAS